MLLLLILLAALASANRTVPSAKVYAKCIRELDGMSQYETSICGPETLGFEVFCINFRRTYRCDGTAWRQQRK